MPINTAYPSFNVTIISSSVTVTTLLFNQCCLLRGEKIDLVSSSTSFLGMLH
jgi:hypothetical protein